MTDNFKIEAELSLSSDVVTCEVHSGDLSFDQTMECMVKLRDHLTARINAAATECPFSTKGTGRAEADRHRRYEIAREYRERAEAREKAGVPVTRTR